ncbi:hypothetical protein L596_004113 [Steinernema carpocapsae]|uniref:PHD-type domain-containing protein n=1 Tax=Steinernema carpocapsae TaxID=34508 RepID=A0A4U8UUS4_STECR|nr:hypothetical protein L596_004113 [Steinernema carpocapsae]
MSSLISMPMGANDHLKHLSSPHSLSAVPSPSTASNFSPLHTLNGYSVSGVSPTEASTASSFYPSTQSLPPTAANMEMPPNTSVVDSNLSYSQPVRTPQMQGLCPPEPCHQTVICSPFDDDVERARQSAFLQRIKNSGLKTMSDIECRRQMYPQTPQGTAIQMQMPYASTLRPKLPIPYPQTMSGPSSSSSMPPPAVPHASFASPSFATSGSNKPKKETKTKSKSSTSVSRPPSNYSSSIDVKPSPSSLDGFTVPEFKRKAALSQSPSTSSINVKTEFDTTLRTPTYSGSDRIAREGDCNQCKQPITGESPAIKCTALQQGCSHLYHVKCAGLNDPAVDELTRNPDAEWVCSGCSVSIKTYKLHRIA